MVFGELVIPSSRALWDDEDIELEKYETSDFQWEGDISIDKINTLYVIDTPTVIRLFKKCILTDLEPIMKSKNAGLSLYKIEDNIIALYEHKPEFTSGEVIQNIIGLIDKSKDIYGITSSPIALYQGEDLTTDLTCFIRTLSTKNKTTDIPKLNIPNLVTGITANLLSYCIHTKSDCQLFIGFIDAAPLDSVNTEPFLKLFKELGLDIKYYYNLISQAPSNNLYM